MQYEVGSTSIKIGTNLFFTKLATVVENVKEGVITSEPSGRFNDSIPR